MTLRLPSPHDSALPRFRVATPVPVIIRSAHPDDAPELLRLLRLAVPLAVRPATPLGPWAAHIWIRDRIIEASRGSVQTGDDGGMGGRPVVPSPCAYRVAVTERRLVGAAEWRELDGRLFLNSIAVDPLARGQGTGTRLLCDGIRTWTSLEAMHLDVFDAMPQAHHWYRQLGFSETGRRTWVRFPPYSSIENDAASDLPVIWKNKAEAASQHQQHGCSMLRLHVPSTDPETHTVGRIGRSVFRITRPATLRHAAVRAFLHRLNPSRHLLYLSSPESHPLSEPSASDSAVTPDASRPVHAPTEVHAPTDLITGARGAHLATSIRMHHASPLEICA